MKVFISWSGERSRLVAEQLNDWIPCVLQAAKPWLSSKDIDRGSLWFSQITDQLQDTNLGIVCLTAANKEKPWILFESGALAKGLSSARVCTFLIDIEPADVQNPLGQFNHTLPDKAGVRNLVETLNSCLPEDRLSETVLDNVFETYWPQFERRFKEIMDTPSSEGDFSGTPRTDDDKLDEVLTTIRSMDRRVRYIEKPNFTPASSVDAFKNIDRSSIERFWSSLEHPSSLGRDERLEEYRTLRDAVDAIAKGAKSTSKKKLKIDKGED